jgi:nucleoid-associated protein Lsr2
MAEQVSVRFVDDIDGSEASETVSFGLDGRQYAIDLSKQHASQLRDALASFVSAARRGTGHRRTSSTSRGTTATDREQTAAIRQWARDNGQSISDRGRISKTLMEAYANRDSTPAPVDAAEPKKKAKKRSKKPAS